MVREDKALRASEEMKTARGGKKNDQQQESEDGGGTGSSADPGAVEGSSPGDKIDQLSELVKALMQSQTARDKTAEKESSRQGQRWKMMQQQLKEMQGQVHDVMEDQRQGPESGRKWREAESDHADADKDLYSDPGEMTSRDSGFTPGLTEGTFRHRAPKLLPLAPDDDIEDFLATFERMAHVCHWPQDEWAVLLVPLLTGKARSAYVMMDINHLDNYSKVKEAILTKYGITPDTYRQRFRSLEMPAGETPGELYAHLKDLFCKWVKPDSSTIQDVTEALVLEQFLWTVNPELEVWIREHNPKSAEEAVRLADVFIPIRKGSRGVTFGRPNSQPGRRKPFVGERGGQTQTRTCL